ncbi:hypothetical protein BH11PAT1_BH11PAT1_1740 [soil metagenome]
MSQRLLKELKSLDFDQLNTLVKDEFLQRLQQEKLIMDEDPFSHICVYTLPYYAASQQVLIGYHIKADKWLIPGGHIDADETIKETAVREIGEELGQRVQIETISEPFFFDITRITSKPPRQCTTHYSIWVYFPSLSNKTILDASEFYASTWMSIDEAIAKTADQANKDALQKFLTILC